MHIFAQYISSDYFMLYFQRILENEWKDFLLLIIISWNLSESCTLLGYYSVPNKIGSQILLTNVFSGLSKKR